MNFPMFELSGEKNFAKLLILAQTAKFLPQKIFASQFKDIHTPKIVCPSIALTRQIAIAPREQYGRAFGTLQTQPAQYPRNMQISAKANDFCSSGELLWGLPSPCAIESVLFSVFYGLGAAY
ncbi:MAG: hypothetical protein K2L96_06885 [Muribaculaceae bacterium]|nr:hypothetical protein [Muribaculaceae bacterium]